MGAAGASDPGPGMTKGPQNINLGAQPHWSRGQGPMASRNILSYAVLQHNDIKIINKAHPPNGAINGFHHLVVAFDKLYSQAI